MLLCLVKGSLIAKWLQGWLQQGAILSPEEKPLFFLSVARHYARLTDQENQALIYYSYRWQISAAKKEIMPTL